jgi:hypothetical protein
VAGVAVTGSGIVSGDALSGGGGSSEAAGGSLGGGNGSGGVAGSFREGGEGAGAGTGTSGAFPQAAKMNKASNRPSVFFKSSPLRVLERLYTLLCAALGLFNAWNMFFVAFRRMVRYTDSIKSWRNLKWNASFFWVTKRLRAGSTRPG